MSSPEAPFWSRDQTELFDALAASPSGLSSEEASARLRRFGRNVLAEKERAGDLSLFFSQFRGPIILLLLVSAALSAFLRDIADASIILAILIISGYLQYREEKKAADVIEDLLKVVSIKAAVLRDGERMEIPVEDVVRGDVVTLGAGDLIPGDSRVLTSGSLFVDEATLTGETFPAEKSAGVLPSDTPLARRSNSLFMGTHVVSGTASALVVGTGRDTEFGKVAERLRVLAPETEFERGVRRFGYMLMEWTLLLVLVIFAVNVYLKRPFLDAFLFALALAVGFTPQLLPAIISITLAKGAKMMAAKKVIVKRLASIENFGSMNVLCSDKTGTLTEGVVTVQGAMDIDGRPSGQVRLYAFINSAFETGYRNPVDEAVRGLTGLSTGPYEKIGEIPYDFIRKRLTVIVKDGASNLMVTKGAVSNVLSVCSHAQIAEGRVVALAEVAARIEERFRAMSGQGLRLLGVAFKNPGPVARAAPDLESGMTFLGFLVLQDPLKDGIVKTVAELRETGITLKVITGDNRFVAGDVGRRILLRDPVVLTGPEIQRTADPALVSLVDGVDVFAEVEPNQKERIVLALKKAGNVVGYMGDGMNDAPAIHTADIGISVDSAVDVVKDAADIVLLEKGLDVLCQGVAEGRKIFANTLKYVMITTSANFGNMFSMACVSPFLPFLPLLPKQIMLNNFLTDIPAMAIASDRVDPEMVSGPRRWDTRQIRRFMVVFGLQSSIFDLVTFAVLLLYLKAAAGEFQTGWFLESALSEILILLVIRTRRPFFRSPPGKALAIAGVAMVAATVILILPPLGTIMGFVPIPASYAAVLMAILGLYVATAEMTKKYFFRS